MISVDALLFDLDGTLIDSKRDLARSVQYLQKQYRVTVSSDEQVAAFVGDGVVKLVERALPVIAASERADAVVLFKDYYREHCLDHTRAYPGARDMLKHFRHKKLAIVTNKPVRISGRILDGLGLSPYFQVLIGGDSLPNKKPHPEPILNALQTMRIKSAKRAVMIGDSPNDVISGRSAGTRTCGVRSNIGDYLKLTNSRPDLMVKNLRELMTIFQLNLPPKTKPHRNLN